MAENKEIEQKDAALDALIAEKTAEIRAQQRIEEEDNQETAKKLNIQFNDDFTATATLPLGVFYENRLHKTIKMRLFLVSDNLENTETNNYLKLLQMYTTTIVSLGEIPKEQLTFDFFKNNMPSKELDTLIVLQTEIKKKREETPGI